MDCSNVGFFVLLGMVVTLVRAQHYLSSDDEYLDCVDIRQQIAFNHELLTHHQIQESPLEIPKALITTKSNRKTQQAHFSTADCPEGTIPVRHDESVVNNDNTRVHEYATRNMKTPSASYGTKTTINVSKPRVEKGRDEISVSQIWIGSGDYEAKDLNTVEVGWIVYPSYYMDEKPRLFIYWTIDAYNETGCYDLHCPGFIQTSRTIVLGGPISPISAFQGDQFEITVMVWKDRKYGNWWLSLGPNNTLVGYWPAEIFTKLGDNAVTVDWGGEITDSRAFGRHTKTQMGSGRFPDEGFGKASYFRNIEIVDSNTSLQSIESIPKLKTSVDDSKCYDIEIQYGDDWGSYFFYGGPGLTHKHSRAVRPGICSCFLFFYIALFFSFSIFTGSLKKNTRKRQVMSIL